MGDLAVEGLLERQRLPLVALQPRLRIEQVDVRRPAVHEEEDHPLRPGDVVAGPRRQGIGTQRLLLGEALRKQAGERRHAEPAAAAAEQVASAHPRGHREASRQSTNMNSFDITSAWT
jgi:hypothetical protein